MWRDLDIYVHSNTTTRRIEEQVPDVGLMRTEFRLRRRSAETLEGAPVCPLAFDIRSWLVLALRDVTLDARPHCREQFDRDLRPIRAYIGGPGFSGARKVDWAQFWAQ